jgi:hypothetical protein
MATEAFGCESCGSVFHLACHDHHDACPSCGSNLAVQAMQEKAASDAQHARSLRSIRRGRLILQLSAAFLAFMPVFGLLAAREPSGLRVTQNLVRIGLTLVLGHYLVAGRAWAYACVVGYSFLGATMALGWGIPVKSGVAPTAFVVMGSLYGLVGLVLLGSRDVRQLVGAKGQLLLAHFGQKPSAASRFEAVSAPSRDGRHRSDGGSKLK